MITVKDLEATPQSSPPTGSPDIPAGSVSSATNQNGPHDHTPAPDSVASATTKRVWSRFNMPDYVRNCIGNPDIFEAYDDDDACMHCGSFDCAHCDMVVDK